MSLSFLHNCQDVGSVGPVSRSLPQLSSDLSPMPCPHPAERFTRPFLHRSYVSVYCLLLKKCRKNTCSPFQAESTSASLTNGRETGMGSGNWLEIWVEFSVFCYRSEVVAPLRDDPGPLCQGRETLKRCLLSSITTISVQGVVLRHPRCLDPTPTGSKMCF